MKPKLIPPDRERCQCLKPNGNTFMTLGGRPGHERCTEKPTVIVTETKPGNDGQRGSMALCDRCLGKLIEQQGTAYFTQKQIRRRTAK